MEISTELLLQRIEDLEGQMQQVRDGTLGWETRIKARAYLSASQAVVSATWTKIALNTETYDAGNNFNTTLNRFIAPTPGYYLIRCNILWESVVADKRYHASIYKNGSLLSESWFQSSYAEFISTTHIDIPHLNKDDYIELYGYHTTGVNKNAYGGTKYTFMSIHLLSKDYGMY